MTAASAPTTLPAELYRDDPAQWQAERKAIFARTWQFMGHESSLPETGSWIADTLAGYPIVVVRDQTGALRGYHNVCRHRAGPLTDGPSGKCDGMLVCRYHGWAYTLDGRLRLARDFGPSSDFDPRDHGLFPVRVETWRGLIFVAVDADIAPLAEAVAPLERRLQGRDWSDLEVALVRNHPIAANWKTYVENYLEGYHVPSIHPSLDAEIIAERYTVTRSGLRRPLGLAVAQPRRQCLRHRTDDGADEPGGSWVLPPGLHLPHAQGSRRLRRNPGHVRRGHRRGRGDRRNGAKEPGRGRL